MVVVVVTLVSTQHRAADLLQVAVHHGHLDAIGALGLHYANMKDWAKAQGRLCLSRPLLFLFLLPLKEMAELGSSKGHCPSQLLLARIYENGLGGTKDLAKAFDWYNKAAGLGGEEQPRRQIDTNVLEAMLVVSNMYTQGIGVAQNIAK